MSNCKSHAEKMEQTIQQIRKVCNVTESNSTICERKINPEQKRKIKAIISKSKMPGSLVCKILQIRPEVISLRIKRKNQNNGKSRVI